MTAANEDSSGPSMQVDDPRTRSTSVPVPAELADPNDESLLDQGVVGGAASFPPPVSASPPIPSPLPSVVASVLQLDTDCEHSSHPQDKQHLVETPNPAHEHLHDTDLVADHHHDQQVVDAEGNVKLDDRDDLMVTTGTIEDVMHNTILSSAIASEAALDQAIGPKQTHDFPTVPEDRADIAVSTGPVLAMEEPPTSALDTPPVRGRNSSRTHQETPERRFLPRILLEQYTSYSEQAGPAGCVEAVCVHCGASIRGQRNVTSNFIQHIRRRHPDAHKIFTARSIRRSTSKKPRHDSNISLEDPSTVSRDTLQQSSAILDASLQPDQPYANFQQMTCPDVAALPATTRVAPSSIGTQLEPAVVPSNDVSILGSANSSRALLPAGAPKVSDVLRMALTWPALDDAAGKFPSPLERRFFVQRTGLPRKLLLVKREDRLPSGSFLFRAAYAFLRPISASDDVSGSHRDCKSEAYHGTKLPGILSEVTSAIEKSHENGTCGDPTITARSPHCSLNGDNSGKISGDDSALDFPKDELSSSLVAVKSEALTEPVEVGISMRSLGENGTDGESPKAHMPPDVCAGMPSAPSVAVAAQLWGRNCTVALPRGSPGRLIGEIEDVGARVVLCEASTEKASRDAARRAARSRLCQYVDVFDCGPGLQGLAGGGGGASASWMSGAPWDLRVVAAYGSLGLEMLRQAPGLRAVYVSGGCVTLFAGLWCVFGALKPGGVRLVGVELSEETTEEDEKKNKRKRKRKSIGDEENVDEDMDMVETEEAENVEDGEASATGSVWKDEKKDERGWKAYAGQIVSVTRREAHAAVRKVYDACEGTVLDPNGVLSIAGALKHEPTVSAGDIVCIVGERLWNFERLSTICDDSDIPEKSVQGPVEEEEQWGHQ